MVGTMRSVRSLPALSVWDRLEMEGGRGDIYQSPASIYSGPMSPPSHAYGYGRSLGMRGRTASVSGGASGAERRIVQERALPRPPRSASLPRTTSLLAAAYRSHPLPPPPPPLALPQPSPQQHASATTRRPQQAQQTSRSRPRDRHQMAYYHPNELEHIYGMGMGVGVGMAGRPFIISHPLFTTTRSVAPPLAAWDTYGMAYKSAYHHQHHSPSYPRYPTLGSYQQNSLAGIEFPAHALLGRKAPQLSPGGYGAGHVPSCESAAGLLMDEDDICCQGHLIVLWIILTVVTIGVISGIILSVTID